MPDERATGVLGQRLARGLRRGVKGMLVTLSGELGAGKSTLVRAFLRELGCSGPVPSPTYTLVEPYELDLGDFFHVDLYRLASAEELEFLGWSDMREAFVLVEWPEKAGNLAQTADLRIDLTYSGTGREARLRTQTAAGEAWLSTVELGPLLANQN